MDAPAPGSRFRFVQLELPWALGPADGRYVLRGHAGEPEHVLVLETLGAPPRRRRLSRRVARARREEPNTPHALAPLTIATLVAAAPLPGDDVALQWLESADLAAEVRAAVEVLNRVLHAERLVRADPFVREVSAAQAIALRIGIGRGEEVAEGHWTAARALDATAFRPRSRESALRPQERFAALLAGRDVALAAEELTLRARLDLDRGRTREAALQLRVALEAALAELQAWSRNDDVASRLTALRGDREAVAGAANRALEGGLDAKQIAAVSEILSRVEAALAARTAGGLD
ncbi:MAG TPA: hypothetical protein VFG42_16020 [Baekduia sp.]|uniref:hypothetical protein n=1 Tax=Baekduia sp. TaxID=2600305 RepID=UPI002D77A44C|nr:hypothetical protein [Baekduia sp.]HET6508300.1 hypothetical protein [Baekduia sp.]